MYFFLFLCFQKENETDRVPYRVALVSQFTLCVIRFCSQT